MYNVCYIVTFYLLCTDSTLCHSGLSVFNKELIDCMEPYGSAPITADLQACATVRNIQDSVMFCICGLQCADPRGAASNANTESISKSL